MLSVNKCGIGLVVNKGVRINKPKRISLGKRVYLDRNSSIYIDKINAQEPTLKIGNNVLIGAYTSIGCSNEVIIEDNVLFAPHVHVTDRNHAFEDISRPINIQPAISPGPVFIGAETWLGYGVQVMPNVHIGKHCVIAAGSIVTKDIPDYCVAAGIPAKIIKKYNFETSEWEKQI